MLNQHNDIQLLGIVESLRNKGYFYTSAWKQENLITDSELAALTQLTLIFVHFPQCPVTLTRNRIFPLFVPASSLPKSAFSSKLDSCSHLPGCCREGLNRFSASGICWREGSVRWQPERHKMQVQIKKNMKWWPWKDPLQMAPLVYQAGVWRWFPQSETIPGRFLDSPNQLIHSWWKLRCETPWSGNVALVSDVG